MRRIYLDHNATTPPPPAVSEAMQPYLGPEFGNPSSIHSFGRRTKAALERAREKTARLLGAEAGEIVFTSSGTESINWALIGGARARRDQGRRIITTQIEHPAVLESCGYLEREGFEVIYLPVDNTGLVLLDKFKEAVTLETILISIAHANNVVGTIQPIAELREFISHKNILFHTDAVQSTGKIPVDVNELGVDLLSFSGHKLYGPKGIGGLYVRRGKGLPPFLHGGAQEQGRRAGTENVAGAVGLGKACELAGEKLAADVLYLRRLARTLWENLQGRIPNISLNGHATERLPGTLNISFGAGDGASLVRRLDLEGIAVSSGPACKAGASEPSTVLQAMGLEPGRIRSAIRISLGRGNTADEVEAAAEVFARLVGC